jgi:uncharacterized membrane protein YhaH (DUF805 family)
MYWYLDALHHYMDFNGRLHRTGFWLFQCVNVCFVLAFAAVSVVVELLAIATFIYNLAMLIPSLAVTARRLHDTDRSAWWMLLFFIPIIGWAWLVFILIQESTAEENRYGPMAGY